MTVTATDSTVTPTVGSTAGSTVLNPSPGQASTTFTLTVNPAPLAITPSTLPVGTVGQTYAASLSETGGLAPYTWAVTSGSLPAGLSLEPNTGAITGTPTGAGGSTVGITVTDSSNPTAATASGTYTLTVDPARLQLAIATGPLPSGTVSQPYSATVAATGGTTPYSWSATGIPKGLTLNTTTGVLSGTPTKAGTFTVTVKVADSSTPAGRATATLTLTVNPQLAMAPSALAAGTVGQTYAASLSGSGGVAPYTWAVTSGSLAAGLSLDPNTGAITGTPTTAGGSTVGITVTDSSNPTPATASRTFSLTVRPAKLAIAITSLPSGTIKHPYSAIVTATGGTTPYSWSATGLPAGLNLNTATGVLSGTPTKAGTYNVRVKVTDSSLPVQTASMSSQVVIST